MTWFARRSGCMSPGLRYARLMTSNPVLIEITQLCPGLPVISADLQPVYADLVSWADTVLGEADSSVSAKALAAMLVHSRHLQTLGRLHQDTIAPILQGQGAAIVTTACDELRAKTPTIRDDAAMMRAIRQLRQRSALAVALSDLATKADVATQMQWLSSAAETAVRATVRYLFDRAAGRGQCPPPKGTTTPNGALGERCSQVVWAWARGAHIVLGNLCNRSLAHEDALRSKDRLKA